MDKARIRFAHTDFKSSCDRRYRSDIGFAELRFVSPHRGIRAFSGVKSC